ncbi:MAG: hypothetical protein ACE5KU_06510 [Nitrososphaerales archaeon]
MSIIDLDLKRVIEKVEARYKIRLPRQVVAVDYGSRGDLYLRFKHVEKPVGEPTGDGRAIIFYQNRQEIVAVEILDPEAYI